LLEAEPLQRIVGQAFQPDAHCQMPGRRVNKVSLERLTY